MYNIELPQFRILFFILDIVQLVKSVQSVPFRPSVPQNACDPKLYALMQESWAENPAVRPSFQAINKLVKIISKWGICDIF